jgi:hypothetical protein
MFSEIIEGTSRASGSVIVCAAILLGASHLTAQLIMHREAERAVPRCEAGYRAKPPAPNLEELGRELTRELLKHTLPKEYDGLTDLLTGKSAPPKAIDYAARCRCLADAALDDAGLKGRYWLWVGTLKLVGSGKPDFHSSMARAEQTGICGKEG